MKSLLMRKFPFVGLALMETKPPPSSLRSTITRPYMVFWMNTSFKIQQSTPALVLQYWASSRVLMLAWMASSDSSLGQDSSNSVSTMLVA